MIVTRLFVFLVASCLSTACAAAAELRRLPYGTTASPSHLPVWVAKDAGYFEKHGLNVEPVQIRGGSLIALAIITGDLPFSGVGAESIIAARAAGGDVILLACPVDTDPVYLITRPEIKSAAELAEIIACVGLAQNMAALRALATEGIQRGHMSLHARQIALSAGAKGDQIEKIAAQMVAEKAIRVTRAEEILKDLIS